MTAVQHIQTGGSLQDMVNDDELATTLVRNLRGLQYLHNAVQSQAPLRNKRVIWLSGSTGVGKTRAAIEFATKHKQDYWMSNEDLKWFDGYRGQRIAIFDDFRWKHCTFSFLLRLLDRYELQVPVKGGFVRWNPEIIFVTTPKNPRETFTTEWREEEDLRQIERRCHFQLVLPRDKNALVWPMLDAIFQTSPMEVEEDPVVVDLPVLPVPSVEPQPELLVVSSASDDDFVVPETQSPQSLFDDVYDNCGFCNKALDVCECF